MLESKDRFIDDFYQRLNQELKKDNIEQMSYDVLMISCLYKVIISLLSDLETYDKIKESLDKNVDDITSIVIKNVKERLDGSISNRYRCKGFIDPFEPKQ